MDKIEIIILVILLIILLVAFINLFIFCNMPLYNYIYEHKDWKKWQYWLKHYDDFVFDYLFNDCFYFKTKDNKYTAIVWSDGMASIHNEETRECLCKWFKKQSKEMAELLMSKMQD